MAQHLAGYCVGDQGIDHIHMALANGLIYFHILFAFCQCQARCFQQLVGYSAQCANHHNAIICLLTDDMLYLTNTLYRTYRGSTEFQDFHNLNANLAAKSAQRYGKIRTYASNKRKNIFLSCLFV